VIGFKEITPDEDDDERPDAWGDEDEGFLIDWDEYRV
jgi:hypothetical protein